MRAGRLKYRVMFRRYTATEDAAGHEIKTWADYAGAYADVVFSKGSERRDAAQEGASLPATFIVRRNDKTAALKVTDRIAFDGVEWDIVSIVPSREFRAGYDIDAVRVAA